MACPLPYHGPAGFRCSLPYRESKPGQYPEVAWGDGDTFYMYELDGTLLWTAPIAARPFTGCSGFDLDGDGAAEALFSDETDVYVFDGKTGSVLLNDPTHVSWTGGEYPIAADINEDGHAEILAPGGINAAGDPGLSLAIFSHDGAGWTPAGPGWGLPDYAVTNSLPNGQVPRWPEPSWHALNLWRARPVADPNALADLAVVNAQWCGAEGSLEVAVANRGPATIPAAISLVVDACGSVVAQEELPPLAPGSALEGIVLRVDGVPHACTELSVTAESEEAVQECDGSNNTLSIKY